MYNQTAEWATTVAVIRQVGCDILPPCRSKSKSIRRGYMPLPPLTPPYKGGEEERQRRWIPDLVGDDGKRNSEALSDIEYAFRDALTTWLQFCAFFKQLYVLYKTLQMLHSVQIVQNREFCKLFNLSFHRQCHVQTSYGLDLPSISLL